MILCVLFHLTWLPLLGGGRKSWYIIIIGSRAPHCRTVVVDKNGLDQTPKASPKKQSIMEYMPGLHQDTKPLRSCSGNPAKILLKGQFGIKCHSEYNNVIRLLQYRCGWQWMHCAGPRDYHSFGLTCIQFHPPKVTPLTLTRSRLRDSATVTLTPGDGLTAIKWSH